MSIAIPAAAEPPAADWEGAYAGAQLGHADAETGDGTLGGLHAGYRFDRGRIVAGAELDKDFGDIALGGDTALRDLGRIKLTGGVEVGPALVYATGGAAFGEVDTGTTFQNDQGWFAGIGAVYPVGQRLTLGAEVLHHEFRDFDGIGSDLRATTATARVSVRF
jgi:opacity protein-like surface antigen